MRIAVGSIMQETNTFSPVPGTLDSFRRVFYACGDAVAEQLGDSSTEVTGFYDVLLAAGHGVVPTVAAMAVSGGRLTRPTYELLRDQLISRLAGEDRLDGLLLALHGAMCVEGDDDGDGSLLADVRAVVGSDLPVFVTHDLHANLTKRRASLCDGIVGYHTAPHVDHRETGRRAARLLLRTLEEKIRPRNYLRKLPFIAPSVRMNTAISPLGPIIKRAQELEANPLTPAISAFWMQPWLDVEEAGAAVNVVCYGSPQDASGPLEELGDAMWETRHELSLSLWTARDAIREALREEGRPCVFADTGDAPSGGAAGDSNHLLAALAEARGSETALITLTDAEAAKQMHAAGTGAELCLRLGGSVDRERFEPLPFTGRVGRLTDGKFRYSGEIAKGQEVCMGLAGVFEVGAIKVVVHERPVFTHDPALYRSYGLEPAEAKIVVVKTPTQFRACYEPFAHRIFEIDTPGVCNTNLTSFNFERIPRPMFPFDPDEVVSSSQFLRGRVGSNP
jgi:microcystin degradation protein MlrC